MKFSILKPALLLLCGYFTTSYGFRYEVKKGHCPTRPGDIKALKLNPEILQGQWLNIFDRAGLNQHLKCYSVRFEQ